MGRSCEMASQLGQVGTARLPSPHVEASDFRTMLKRYLLDPVLPALTLVLMAVMTTAILILVVLAVDNMEQSLQRGSVSDDPWSAMASGPSPANPQASADDAATMAEMQAQESQLDSQAGEPADAAYVVRDQPDR